MTKTRIMETDSGITGHSNTRACNELMPRLRDRGWMETSLILKESICGLFFASRNG